MGEMRFRVSRRPSSKHGRQGGEVCQGSPKDACCSLQEQARLSHRDHQFSRILKAAPCCPGTRHTHFSSGILFVLICCPRSDRSGEIIYTLHRSSNYSLRVGVSNICHFSGPAHCWTHKKIHFVSRCWVSWLQPCFKMLLRLPLVSFNGFHRDMTRPARQLSISHNKELLLK